MDFRFVLITIITIIMGIAIIALLGRAWRGQRQANAARTWPQTPGRVVASGTREKIVRVRSSTSVASYRNQIFYAPQIVYNYEVDGRHYQHDRLRMGDSILTSDHAEAQRNAARYPIGEDVTVYYNPANPADSTLDPRPAWGTRLNWIIALLLLVITIIIDLVFLSSPPITF